MPAGSRCRPPAAAVVVRVLALRGAGRRPWRGRASRAESPATAGAASMGPTGEWARGRRLCAACVLLLVRASWLWSWFDAAVLWCLGAANAAVYGVLNRAKKEQQKQKAAMQWETELQCSHRRSRRRTREGGRRQDSACRCRSECLREMFDDGIVWV